LVGKDETVDCPECGKKCEGGQSLETHRQMKHKGSEESSYPFTSQRQIFDQIAESSSFDWRTVSNLISVSEIPEQFHAFVKIPEEYRSEIFFSQNLAEIFAGNNFVSPFLNLPDRSSAKGVKRAYRSQVDIYSLSG